MDMRSIEPQPLSPLWTGALLQDVFDAAPDATIGADESGSIVIANTRVTEMFGYERSEVLGQMVELLLLDRLREPHLGQRKGVSGAPHRRPMGTRLLLSARHRDGTEFPVEVSLSPIQTDHGPVVLAAVRDVSERLQMQAHSDALDELLRMKTDVLNILSHELFTPITTIQGTAATLLSTDVHDVDAETLRGLVNGVRAASARLRRLMRFVDLAAAFDLGGIRAPVEGIAVGEIINGAIADVELARFYRDVRLHTDEDVMERRVLADGQLAELAIVVVLENALALAPGEPVDVGLVVQGDQIEVRISDNGPGIPEDMRERIFDPFSQLDTSDTRHHEGAGIGLYLAQKIVETYGGRIEVVPRAPSGSTFVLPFPLA